MDISLFDYQLPEKLIAQFPASCRSKSRLLVLDRKSGELQSRLFHDILDYLKPGDGLVVNTTKVFKARLISQRKSGAKVEIFLVRPSHIPNDGKRVRWEALVSPSRRVDAGEEIGFGADQVLLESYHEQGRWTVSFPSESKRKQIVASYGQLPLPPYVRRKESPADLKRYQTIFADKAQAGAVAAPTAGLHFTRALLDKIKRKGVRVIPVCLHVGPGTFKPVSVEQIEQHAVDPEFAELTADSAKAINAVRKSGGRIFAVGTTSVRTLESAKLIDGQIQPFGGMVDLYIRPGFKFRMVDHLITNFHLPKSSLLILVSAFAGRESILNAYQLAIAEQFRFYSYGDAMLIV